MYICTKNGKFNIVCILFVRVCVYVLLCVNNTPTGTFLYFMQSILCVCMCVFSHEKVPAPPHLCGLLRVHATDAENAHLIEAALYWARP